MPSAQARGTAQSGDDGQWMDRWGALAWLGDESPVPQAVPDVEVLVRTVLSLSWVPLAHAHPPLSTSERPGAGGVSSVLLGSLACSSELLTSEPKAVFMSSFKLSGLAAFFLCGPSCSGVRSVKGRAERAWWAQLAAGRVGLDCPCIPWLVQKDVGTCEML